MEGKVTKSKQKKIIVYSQAVHNQSVYCKRSTDFYVDIDDNTSDPITNHAIYYC